MPDNVRPALSTDLAVLELLYTERQTIVTQADPRLRPLPGTSQWLGRANGLVWVGGQPVGGYISVWVNPWPGGILPAHAALIDHMALDAHAYHPGLGRALNEAAVAWAKGRGATVLWALVPRYDPVGQAFWRSLGAQPTDDDALSKLTGYQVFQQKL